MQFLTAVQEGPSAFVAHVRAMSLQRNRESLALSTVIPRDSFCIGNSSAPICHSSQSGITEEMRDVSLNGCVEELYGKIS